ncbi:CPBP family intramembrane metalloprotease [Bacillus sp. AGMB 02131]|uniref:CPBP family intramembrane metalloprotease n=1 Tax=Peribacillus faecalis TaxID=2772559 RepID=A0A927HB34_9BACI|nr:CPBP family intramembrane glutamic endopeptidase [Peribacillus faecalis]MBD3108172.1 CPBP family intramembrane metalloprotease [Peribacillus faecalis]
MSQISNAKEQVKTGWILASISITLTASILFWYFGNPDSFVEKRIGYTPDVFSNMMVWLFTFFIIVGYVAYTAYAVPFVKENLFRFSWLKVLGIWVAITTGIMEEIVFRQMLMDWMMSLELTVVWQIIGSAVAFGLAHGTWVLLRGELKIALPVILSTTVLGGLLAILYIVSGRSTFAPIIAHVLINVAIEPWLMLSAVSGKWDKSK